VYIPSGVRMLKRRVLRRSDGERYLKASYRSLSDEDLDCANPSTFTAKMFQRLIWINRHGHPEFSRLADKYRVRDYVTARLARSTSSICSGTAWMLAGFRLIRSRASTSSRPIMARRAGRSPRRGESHQDHRAFHRDSTAELLLAIP